MVLEKLDEPLRRFYTEVDTDTTGTGEARVVERGEEFFFDLFGMLPLALLFLLLLLIGLDELFGLFASTEVSGRGSVALDEILYVVSNLLRQIL